MRSVLLLLASLHTLGACSVLFSGEPKAGPSEEVDASLGNPDAGRDLSTCTRVIKLSDKFADDTAGANWQVAVGANGSVMESGGTVNVSLNGAGARGGYRWIDPFDLELAEVIVDIANAGASGAQSVVSIVPTGTSTRLATVRAGQLQQGFGWSTEGMDGGGFDLVDDGGNGPWRIRLAGSDVIVETLELGRSVYREVGRLTESEEIGPYSVGFDATQLSAPNTVVNFESIEISGAPPEGWCPMDLFQFSPMVDNLNMTFRQHLNNGGDIAEANGLLSLGASMPDSYAVLSSLNRFSIRNRALVIGLEGARAMPAGNVVVELQHSSLNRIGFWITGVDLRGFTDNAGDVNWVSKTYDSTGDKFLRISEVSPGSVLFETSSDGQAWKAIDEDKPEPLVDFPLNDLEVHLRVDGVDSESPERVELNILRLSGEHVTP